jgi:hypothetical protein
MPRSQGSAIRCTWPSTGCLAISRIRGGTCMGWPLPSGQATVQSTDTKGISLNRPAVPSTDQRLLCQQAAVIVPAGSSSMQLPLHSGEGPRRPSPQLQSSMAAASECR